VPVRFFYVDESYDKEKFCLSAISIRHDDWKDCFDRVKTLRKRMRQTYGLYLTKEIHAHDLLAGKGRLSAGIITKHQRSRIFYEMLECVAAMPNVFLMNVCLDRERYKDAQLVAWDRLVNRIERTMLEFDNREQEKRAKWIRAIRQRASCDELDQVEERLNMFRSRAVIVADEGREQEIERAIRKMHVHNPIPSKFGEWAPGKATQNIPAERVIEDPFFKPSRRSYFIQLADCVAFALLKREVQPTPRIAKYGVHKMWDQTLPPKCYAKASWKDPYGIVRD
jgi:hypothetical protein